MHANKDHAGQHLAQSADKREQRKHVCQAAGHQAPAIRANPATATAAANATTTTTTTTATASSVYRQSQQVDHLRSAAFANKATTTADSSERNRQWQAAYQARQLEPEHNAHVCAASERRRATSSIRAHQRRPPATSHQPLATTTATTATSATSAATSAQSSSSYRRGQRRR